MNKMVGNPCASWARSDTTRRLVLIGQFFSGRSPTNSCFPDINPLVDPLIPLFHPSSPISLTGKVPRPFSTRPDTHTRKYAFAAHWFHCRFFSDDDNKEKLRKNPAAVAILFATFHITGGTSFSSIFLRDICYRIVREYVNGHSAFNRFL